MKNSRILLLCALLAIGARSSDAVSFDDLLAGFSSTVESEIEAYVQPLADANALLASSGAFHSGRSKGLAGLELGVKATALPFSSGDQSGILADTELKTAGVPMLVLSKGLFKGFQVGARGMLLELSKDLGRFTLFGASLRWEMNELFHIPLLMPRIGLQGNWNSFKLGETLATSGLSFDFVVSKSLVLIEPYAGYSLGKGTTKVSYATEETTPQQVDVEVDSNIGRLALGCNLTPFPLLRINAEYSLAKYDCITVGLLFSLF